MPRTVLVHGAWQGAWAWDFLVPLLQQRGIAVRTPTLTGSGSRADELTPEVGLPEHIDDVVEAVNGADGETLLVLHSYSGMVAASVVERASVPLVGVMFVDSFYPEAGQSAIDQMPPPFQERFREQAREFGDGWRLPANDGLLDVWGIHAEEQRAWVRARLTDWSLRCFESPSPSSCEALARLPRWFVRGDADYPARAAFVAIAEVAGADGCEVIAAPTGHDVMIEAPEFLAGHVADALGRR